MQAEAEVGGVNRGVVRLADLFHKPLIASDGSLVEPAVVVDLAAVARSRPEDLAAAQLGGRLLIGIAQARLTPEQEAAASALDLTFVPEDATDQVRSVVPVPAPDAAAEQLLKVVAERPAAALTLRSVLRVTSVLDGSTGLLAESHAYSMLLAGPEFADWLASRAHRGIPAPPTHDLVRTHRDGARLDIALNHPERRNAYSARLRDELLDALRIALLDPSIGGVRLRGLGPGFCAGGDLDEFGTTRDPVFAHLVRTTAGVAGTLELLRPRLEVQVHGTCIGAGLELAAFGSHVVADRATTFRLPELAMGLIPGAGGTVSVTRRIGRWRTAYLGLTGDVLNAPQAHQWGLVDEIVQ